MKPRPIPRQRRPRHTAGRLVLAGIIPERQHVRESMSDESPEVSK